MSQLPHDANGFPTLQREPAPLPELGDHPTPLELARAYGSVAIIWCREWPRIVDALYWLRGAVMGAKGEAQAARAEARAARKAVERALRAPVRPAQPLGIDPDSSYNEIATTLNDAAAELYAVAKDPRNPTTVADIIAITQAMISKAKGDSDATRLARRSERRWGLWLVILGAVLTVVGEAVLAHYGIHP